MASLRQRNQQKFWQAIGTVQGFHGYLHNLEDVLKRTGMYKSFPHIDAMHIWLKSTETLLRNDIRNIP